MKRIKTSTVEDVKSALKMPKKNLLPYLKGHHLLRACSKDKPEAMPKVGELVWARVSGSGFWPGFILELKDVENIEATPEIDDSAYCFVMFLEKDYRYSPVAWEQIIPFSNMESQMLLLPAFNKVVVKTSWKPSSGYKKSLEMAVEYSRLSPSKRYDTALTAYKENQARKINNSATKSSSTTAPTTPVKAKEEPPPIKEVINKVLSQVREKKKSGIRVSDRITKKKIDKVKPKPQPKKSAAKTENQSIAKAAPKSNSTKNGIQNQRPDVGGDVLKEWTKERFDDFDKDFTFESSNVHCMECTKEITADETVKTCHGFPFHSSCLQVPEGVDPPVLKCKMCIEKQCFICKTASDNDKLLPKTLKCSKCELRFHIDCLLKDWPQAEIQGSNGPITCPLHFCHSCLGEQKIYSKFRDYTTTFSKSYKCRICLSSYHKSCLPAGCGESIQGKEYIICPKHTLPDIKAHQRRIGCLDCYKPLKQKEAKVECSYCVQVFHPECVGYTEEIRESVPLEVFGQGYKCYSCRWGLFPMYGQVVWFQQPQHQYWPARILFPAEYKGRRRDAKRQAGQYSVEYFGSTLCYDNASRALPLHLTTVEIFKAMKVYQEVPKILRAHEEAAFCHMFLEEYRDKKQVGEPKPVYKKIEKNVYRTVPVPKAKEPSEICNCAEEKGEVVCQADEGCSNRDMEMECSDRICKAGSRCTNRMFSQRKKDEEFLEQKLFPNKGWGVIAKRAFKPGDFVAEYRGEVIDRNEMKWRLSKKEEEDPMYILEISKDFFIDAEYVGNLSRLINHSCAPNCEVRKYLSMGRSVGGIFACRNIEIGDEVTFMYGCGSQSTAPFRCRCGAKGCSLFVGKEVPEGYSADDEPEHNPDKWENVCSKCGFGGSVICCEFPACRKVWHYHCLGLNRKPQRNWCCPVHPAKKVEQLKKANQTPKSKKPKSLSRKISSSSSNTSSSSVKSTATPAQQQAKKKARQSAPAASQQTEDKNVEDLVVPMETEISLTESTIGEPVTVSQPQSHKRRLSATTSTSDVETSEPAKKKQKTEALQVLKDTLETPPITLSTNMVINGRRRRAHSIPSSATSDNFNVPSTPTTRSRRSRRGESVNERTPVSMRCSETNNNHSDAAAELNLLRQVSPLPDLVLDRMSRRRSRNNKPTEPLSHLPLNHCVLPKELPPVHQLNNALSSSEKHVRMGTRSSSKACIESPGYDQVTVPSQPPNGLFTNGLTTSALVTADIKKERMDDGYGYDEELKIEKKAEETRRMRERLLNYSGNADNETDTIRPAVNTNDYQSAKTDTDMKIILQNSKALGSHSRMIRQYSEDTYPL